jgi:hypothetical protein
MYEVFVYPITDNLWRWEIRSGRAIIRCGTASTGVAAEVAANAVIKPDPGAFFRTWA